MLTKCMFTDPTCRELGLQYGQVRQNVILTNAGWFSHLGEKLGVGDLSMQDLSDINKGLPVGEIFFALSEATCLSIPANLDRLAPGIDYVVEHAVWAVNIADIFKIDSKISNQVLEIRDGVSYIKYARTAAINSWVATLAVQSHFKKIEKKSHWGLDVYHMYDGSQYAVGDYSEAYEAASKAAYESLWDTDPDIFARYITLTAIDKDVMLAMQLTSGHSCNNLIAKLLGGALTKSIDYMIRNKGFGYYLDTIDSQEHISDTVPGLPPNLLAYRIDE